jgi:hypothetical protein
MYSMNCKWLILFKYATSQDCQLLTLHIISDRWMTKHDSDTRTIQYADNNLSHCHSINHKHHMDWPQMNLVQYDEKPATACLRKPRSVGD